MSSFLSRFGNLARVK
jgi:hypothetical protein